MDPKVRKQVNPNVREVIEDVTRQIIAWYEDQKTGKQIIELNFKNGIVTPEGYHLHAHTRPMIEKK